MEKRKKKKNKGKLKIKNILLLLIILLAVLIFLFGDKIKVKSYYVTGNKYLTDEQVLDDLKLKDSSSFLYINNLVKKNLAKKTDLIKDVKIKRNIYREVYVNIKEYKILFFDKNKNKTIIENKKAIDYKNNNIPVLINNINDKKIYDKFIRKMVDVDDEILNLTSEISYAPNNIDKERFLFSMNDGNYVYVTLTKLKNINEYKEISASALDNKKGILYLDYGSYFTPKE